MKKEFNSNILNNLIKETPLEVRIRTSIEAHFIDKLGGSFFIPASEEGPEYEEIMRINGEAYNEAQPIIREVLEEVKGWIEDGMPGEIEIPKKDSDEQE